MRLGVRVDRRCICRSVTCYLLLTVVACGVESQRKAAVAFSFVGDFSNVRQTPGHAYGYRLQLWRQGKRVFGLFSDADGIATDTPIGLIDNVHFSSATGSLSFSSRLSIASVYLGKGKLEPSHDLFTFRGRLRSTGIGGVLTHSDQSRPGMQASSKRLHLKKTGTPAMVQASSYDEWRRAVDELLKVRGPKW